MYLQNKIVEIKSSGNCSLVCFLSVSCDANCSISTLKRNLLRVLALPFATDFRKANEKAIPFLD